MNLDPTALITSGAIVIFLVNQLRRWIPTDLLPLAALLIGAIVQVINDTLLSTGPVTTASVWTSVIIGIGIGMVAAGAHDLIGRAGTTIPPATILVDDPTPTNQVASSRLILSTDPLDPGPQHADT